jgi:hypothetical protein
MEGFRFPTKPEAPCEAFNVIIVLNNCDGTAIQSESLAHALGGPLDVVC